jgi:pimeloyl-ACP methyl ester carboxylesterase
MEQLVLLPGLLCDQAVWQGQIDSLSDIADAISIDYGALDSLVSMAEHVLRVAPPEFSLAGHSMGGRIAFEVVRLAPHRVKRLAAFNTGIDPLPLGDAGTTEEKKRRSLLDIARTRGMRAFTEAWLPPMMKSGRMEDHALVESIFAMFERKTPDIYEAQMTALLHRPDARPTLPTIACPALFLSGEQDSWSPPARHVEMQNLVPNSVYRTIGDSGHMAPMEQPAAVAQAMREWLGMAV